jgi:hypothetical protein
MVVEHRRTASRRGLSHKISNGENHDAHRDSHAYAA